MEEKVIYTVVAFSAIIFLVSLRYLLKSSTQETNTKQLVKQAMIATLYIAITWVFRAVSFHAIQFRLSEALLVLVLFNPKFVSGLTLGTFIANILLSDLGIIDWTLGTMASLVSMLLMIKLKKNIGITLTIPAIMNGIIIGLELTYLFETPFIINALSVFVGELAVLVVFGYGLYKGVESNKKFRQLISQ